MTSSISDTISIEQYRFDKGASGTFSEIIVSLNTPDQAYEIGYYATFNEEQIGSYPDPQSMIDYINSGGMTKDLPVTLLSRISQRFSENVNVIAFTNTYQTVNQSKIIQIVRVYTKGVLDPNDNPDVFENAIPNVTVAEQTQPEQTDLEKALALKQQAKEYQNQQLQTALLRKGQIKPTSY